MHAIEMRARELLAAEYDADSRAFTARLLRANPDALGENFERSIRAIASALTPPEGYVLVPVELPVEMEVAFMEAWVSKRRCVDDPEMQDAWAAALAARPEEIR